MAYDYAPVTTPDEEEEERRRLAVTYPPVSAAQPTAIGFSPDPHEARPPLKPAPARFGSTGKLEAEADQPGAMHAPAADYAPAASPALPTSPIPGPRPKPSDYAAPIPAGESGSQLAAPPSSAPNINDDMESGASKLRMMNVGTLRAQAPPDTPYPALGSTADLEARAAQPRAYPAPEPPAPAPSRPQWSQDAPAEKHGWGKFGSIMASLNPISDEIVNERPLRNAERNYKLAEGDCDKQQADKLALQKETSEEGLQGAQTEEAQARADELRHPTPKPKEEEWSIDPNRSGPKGEPIEIEKNSGQTRVATGLPPGVTLNKQNKPDTPEQQSIDAETAKGVPLPKAIQDYARASQRPQQEPGSYMPLYDDKGRVTGAWDPKSGHIVHTPTDMPGNTAAGAGIGERGIETVSAQTPDGPVYESKAAAEAAGHKILNKANPAEREKAKQAYTQYSRMIDNAQEAMSTMPAWKEGSKDRDIAMRVSKQFFSHIPVVGVDPSYVDQFLNSDDYRMMSKQGQANMQNMFQIWSDAINVVKQETGGVPRGQMFLEKEDAILPHPDKTYDMNVKSLNAFVKRMRKDSEEYSRPIEVPPLQGGVAPADAKGYINKSGKRIGYIDAQGKRVEF
jgi:hypothetical protein